MTASGGPPPSGPPPGGPYPPGPPPPYGYPPGPPVAEKTIMPVIGGILIIVGAVIGVITGIFFIVGTAWLIPVDVLGVAELLMICGVIYLIISLIALMGGIFAVQRKAFGFAIVGGILALLVGSVIFGLIGLILVAISRKEFQ